MNPSWLFTPKRLYVAVMVALLVPLYLLSQPSTPKNKRGESSPGGLLAQMRDRSGLSLERLGEIDPASETMRFATLGMRSVASLILWEKANDYYKKKDWPNFSATIDQCIKLQPHFVSIWHFQGWVYSYNCSVQFDDYRDRYAWVIRGINFLRKGIKYNEHEPLLQVDIGTFISQKIGTADEAKEYRKLFKADDDFNGSLPLSQRDNWLVGKQWFREAERMVDAGDKTPESPLMLRRRAPACQINYAEALEKDGTFDEVAKRQWQQAAAEWRQFGSFDLPASNNVTIHLNDQEDYELAARTKIKQLDDMQPGLREKLVEEKRAKLSDEQRKALDAVSAERTSKQEEAQRTPKQDELAAAALVAIGVTHDEVARAISGANRKKALDLAEQIAADEEMATTILRNREIINFAYWRLRADVEQTDEAIAARKWIFKAEEALALGELPDSLQYYKLGFESWRKVLDQFPVMKENVITGKDLMDIIKRYRQLLDQLDEPFPDNFILQDIVKKFENESS
jgi:hypothetical protein